MKRKGISKSVRFEVFKRDKFTCQYCGGKAPDIVLHIDHIHPVSKGGDNGIINLITSCFECNLGKSDRKLNDNSVVEKQRKQLELIQERREQIELMFKWKKSLSNLNDKTVEMIKDFVEAKIHPITISDSGINNLKNHLRKYGIEEVLDAVDISATSYLKFSNVSGVTEESAEMFLSKIGGILFNRNLSPIEQKLAHIKSNAKKNLGYFDPRKASILLKEYVTVLRKYWNYSDDDIVKDLENELTPNLDKEYNWTGWSEFIESWTASVSTSTKKKAEDNAGNMDVQENNNESLQSEQPKKRTKSELSELLDDAQYDLESTISALSYLMKPFPNYRERKFIRHLYEQLAKFIEDTSKYTSEMFKEIDSRFFPVEAIIVNYLTDGEFYDAIAYDATDNKIEGWRLDKLSEASEHIMEGTFRMFYFSQIRFSKNDAAFLKKKSLEYIDGAMEGNCKKLQNRVLEMPDFSSIPDSSHESPPF